MAFDFDYRAVAFTLAAGESRKFDAMRFLALSSASSSIEIAPRGKSGSFGPFTLKQIFEDPDGGDLGPVELRNPTGGAVTFTVVTSNKRIAFSDSSAAQSITIDGVSVTVPVSIAAAVTTAGQAAHDAAIAGAPVHVGGEALAAERAAVTSGDAVRAAYDLHGRALQLPFAHVGDRVGASVAIAAVGVVDLVPAQGAGVRFHLTTLVVSNEDAAADNSAIILDGAAELLRVRVKAGDTVAVTFPVPEHTTANTALRLNVAAATAMRVRARGYKGA